MGRGALAIRVLGVSLLLTLAAVLAAQVFPEIGQLLVGCAFGASIAYALWMGRPPREHRGAHLRKRSREAGFGP